MLEIFKDDAGEYRFRIKGTNGEIVMTSEGYTRRRDAWRGYQTLRGLIRSGNLPTYCPEPSQDDE